MHLSPMPPNPLLPAERMVLGALLRADELAGRVSQMLAPEAFALPEHATIARRVKIYDEHDEPAGQFLEDARSGADPTIETDLAGVGGVTYLDTLLGTSGTNAEVMNAATLVLEASAARDLIRIAEDINRVAADMLTTAFEAKLGQQGMEDAARHYRLRLNGFTAALARIGAGFSA